MGLTVNTDKHRQLEFVRQFIIHLVYYVDNNAVGNSTNREEHRVIRAKYLDGNIQEIISIHIQYVYNKLLKYKKTRYIHGSCLTYFEVPFAA
jgi:hypothetical protein